MKTDDKCVYLHKDKEGVIRYIGSGIMQRAYRTEADSYRGKLYAEFVKTNGKLEVEIVAKSLSKLEAENLERELYDKYVDTTLNIKRPNSARAMTKEMFEDYLYYDETSASCLRWKVDRVGANGAVLIKANSEAGCFDKSNGYYTVKLQRIDYRAHRIVVVLHGLEIDGFVIDHVDRNKANNQISNLRVVSQKENCQNKSTPSNNTSGVQGVYYEKRGSRWIADWYENGKRKSKHFPIKNYSSEDEAFNAATEYRRLMVELYYNKE